METVAQPRLALLCGHCPNRRVLCYLVLMFGTLAVPGARTRREVPQPPAGLPDTWRVAAGEPLRRRCKRGHAWTLPAGALQAAYNDATAAGRREIVAGVDVG